MNAEKYVKGSKYYDLVIEFLLKSKYCIDLEKVSAEEERCLELLKVVAEIDKLFRNRAMSARALLVMSGGRRKELVEIFCNNFEEFMGDIDLEREYVTNFGSETNQDEEEDSFEEER
jgi:hypothetical protein